MRYQCSLNRIEFHARHGMYKEEQLIGGIFILTLETEMNLDASASMKVLNNCIDYLQNIVP